MNLKYGQTTNEITDGTFNSDQRSRKVIQTYWVEFKYCHYEICSK
jgi:hypothetical protein